MKGRGAKKERKSEYATSCSLQCHTGPKSNKTNCNCIHPSAGSSYIGSISFPALRDPHFLVARALIREELKTEANHNATRAVRRFGSVTRKKKSKVEREIAKGATRHVRSQKLSFLACFSLDLQELCSCLSCWYAMSLYCTEQMHSILMTCRTK